MMIGTDRFTEGFLRNLNRSKKLLFFTAVPQIDVLIFMCSITKQFTFCKKKKLFDIQNLTVFRVLNNVIKRQNNVTKKIKTKCSFAWFTDSRKKILWLNLNSKSTKL